jgi:hypothetical protein
MDSAINIDLLVKRYMMTQVARITTGGFHDPSSTAAFGQ